MHLRTLILAGCGALLLRPSALLAHAHRRRSEPAAGAWLPTPPRAISLTFSESPELAFTVISLLDPAGHSLELGTLAKSAADPLTIAAAVPAPLAPGRYAVVWQTASADGHVVRGRYTFEVLAP